MGQEYYFRITMINLQRQEFFIQDDSKCLPICSNSVSNPFHLAVSARSTDGSMIPFQQ